MQHVPIISLFTASFSAWCNGSYLPLLWGLCSAADEQCQLHLSNSDQLFGKATVSFLVWRSNRSSIAETTHLLCQYVLSSFPGKSVPGESGVFLVYKASVITAIEYAVLLCLLCFSFCPLLHYCLNIIHIRVLCSRWEVPSLLPSSLCCSVCVLVFPLWHELLFLGTLLRLKCTVMLSLETFLLHYPDSPVWQDGCWQLDLLT